MPKKISVDNEEPFLADRLAPRPLSRLTFRILSLNVIVIATMAMSLGILNRTRESLISNEIENFVTESRLYAAILADKTIDPDANKRQIFSKLLQKLELRPDQQVFVASPDGVLLASIGQLPLRPAFEEKRDRDIAPVLRLLAAAEDLMSVEFSLPAYPGQEAILHSQRSSLSSEGQDVKISAWSAPDAGLILSSEFAIGDETKTQDKIFLVRRDLRLEKTYAETRLDILRFVAISLFMTVTFSLYLASLIGHPLRKLAQAAEEFRLRKGRGVEIPDMSNRKDEIGELSEAMRDMTGALSKRIFAIEQFAADVAHELKNPLTSMKSAVETLKVVKKDSDKDQLTDILLHDLTRMNRLISDISQASRLDAELTREELVTVDLRDVVLPLINMRSNPMDRAEGDHVASGKILSYGFDRPVMVLGQAGRLAQVFDNLIANALSFSDESAKVIITAEQNEERIKVTVEDEGPGIPANRLDQIFERFYSERPVAEGFGMHSGLGLSIAKQIIESHGGTIHAENRVDGHNNILGARFVVRLRVPRQWL